MNRIKSIVLSLLRRLRLRGEEGRAAPRPLMVLVAVLVGVVGIGAAANNNANKKKGNSAIAATPSHSTTIALTSDEERLVVVNREANSVSIIRVKNAQGNDVANKIAEIGVDEEPRCVAIHPNDDEAYVTNGISGTVSVIRLGQRRVVATIPVGTEPRGCALTPKGTLLYVANHTAGTVSIIDTASRSVAGTVNVGRNPTAIAITNNGNGNEADETVFVTQIFAELNPAFVDPIFDGNGEDRDLGKRGVVQAFPAGNSNPPITKITLSPIANSGFNANRGAFCPKAAGVQPQSLIFCPDPTKPATDPVNANNPQGVFPNQLLSAVIRGDRLFLPNIGSQPEPPETATTNVQALVHQVNTNTLTEAGAQNLNQQINVETALPPPSLDKRSATTSCTSMPILLATSS